MRIKRWMVVTGLLLAVGAAGAGFMVKRNKDAAAAAKIAEAKKADAPLVLAAVDMATAGPTTLVQSLPVAGSVDAAKQAIVRSRHAGTATGMTKRAGDRVQAGERLAKVDSDELRLRLMERESAIKQTQAALGVAESVRAQQRSLAERGFISKTALDSSESNFVAARSAFEAAKSQLDIAKSALNETSLVAPISGVISKRSVEPGERIGNEMAVFTILDPTSLEVVVPVPAERVAELKIGQKASFQLDTGGASVDGTLARIIPTTGSAARTVETRFALPAESGIPAGAFLSGQLRLSQSSAAVAVPSVAVKTDVTGNYLWVVQDGKAKKLRVKLGATSGENVAVTEGLAAGAKVLTLRGAEPNEGQAVTLPGAAPATAATPAVPAAPAAAVAAPAPAAK